MLADGLACTPSERARTRRLARRGRSRNRHAHPCSQLAVSPWSAARTERDGVDLTLGALADPVRRCSVELLAECPHRAGELAEALGVSPAVMSRHLSMLRKADLVEEEHPPFDARVRVDLLRAAFMGALRAWLANAEAGWAQQLGAFKDHAVDG